MRMIPASFNGFNFQQDHNVATDFDTPFDWSILGLSTNTISRSNNFPVFASKGYAGKIKVLEVTLNDVDAIRDSLVIAMDVLGENQHQLIALDELGRPWYVDAVCIGLNEEGTSENTATFGMTFDCDDPIWKKVTPSTQTINVAGTGSGTISPLGNQPALPVITITPTVSGGGGFAYKRFIQVINNSLNPLSVYPINLTGAGLDTSALIADNANKCQVDIVGGIDAVTATIPYDTVTGSIPTSGLIYIGTEQISYTGKTATNFTGCVRGVNGTTAAVHADNAVIYTSKMAADGNDLRIYVDGVEIKRWFGGGGINSTTTKIWVNWTQPANTNMTLGAVISGTGLVSTITMQNTAGNIALMPTIPTSGFVLIGTEVFVYTGVNVSGLQLTGCVRAERQTTAGAHAIADVVKFITHDTWMYYGSPFISPYVVDDTYKPIIKLTSTNSSFIYEEFGDISGLRSGGWSKFETAFADIYTGNQDTDVDPHTAMGIQAGGKVAEAYWSLNNPCGVTTITASGQKYYYNYWLSPTFEISLDGSTWSVLWTEVSPSTQLAWEALSSHSAVALGATYNYLKTRIVGGLGSLSSYSNHELDDVTLTLDATKVPTINIASEANNFTLNSTLTNAATGYSMTISLSMVLGTYIVIDTKNKTITMYDGSNQINALQNMPIRPEWFPLLPNQDNIISITELSTATFEFSFEDRTL